MDVSTTSFRGHNEIDHTIPKLLTFVSKGEYQKTFFVYSGDGSCMHARKVISIKVSRKPNLILGYNYKISITTGRVM